MGSRSSRTGSLFLLLLDHGVLQPGARGLGLGGIGGSCPWPRHQPWWPERRPARRATSSEAARWRLDGWMGRLFLDRGVALGFFLGLMGLVLGLERVLSARARAAFSPVVRSCRWGVWPRASRASPRVRRSGP